MTRPVYRKGTGPGVVVIHELPGLTDRGDRLRRGRRGRGLHGRDAARCSATPRRRTNRRHDDRRLHPGLHRRGVHQDGGRGHAPDRRLAARLARTLHEELGGPGVGALGMCFTGGFALAMMVDDSVAAPVVAQPAVPFADRQEARRRPQPLPRRPRRSSSARAAAGCQVLGLRYRKDPRHRHALRHAPRASSATTSSASSSRARVTRP